MKKAVVTGGLGFIGSYLCERLLEEEFLVDIVDNETNNAVSREFFGSDRVTVHVQDVSSVIRFLGDSDLFFHLASPVGPVGVLNYAGKMGYQTLTDITNIMNYCKKYNSMLIDVSTSEIYGHSGILYEDSDKVFKDYKVRTEYAAAKMTAEIAISGTALVSNSLFYHIIRPFNVSGPRQKPDGGFVLPRFVVAALTGQPITIYGDGTQRRAFTDVKDISDAIFEISTSEHKNEIWNIGNPANEVSINELAELVVKFAGGGDIVHIDPRELHGDLFSEPEDKVPNIDKISSLLGWGPRISLEDTVKSTIEYYRKRISEGYNFEVMGKC